MDHNGMTLNDVAAGFIVSNEFRALYGQTPTNADLVTRFTITCFTARQNKKGFDYWMNLLDNGVQGRNQVLAGFSESNENKLQVIGTIENGFEYIQYAY